MTHAALFLAAAVAVTPLVIAASAALATWWLERFWAPRIAGAE